MVRQEVADGAVVGVPETVVIQARVEGVGRPAVDDVLAGTDLRHLDRDRIELAAQLIRSTRKFDVVDALVAAEALLSAPAIVLTSDPDDIRQLLDADPRGRRVEVWRV